MSNNIELKKEKFLKRARKILNEITKSGEFKKIKKPIFLEWFPSEKLNNSFWNEVFKPNVEAIENPIKHLKKEFPIIREEIDKIKNSELFDKVEMIVLNPRAKHLFRVSNDYIRELLRHELLHIELQKSDDDIDFLKEASKRKIDIRFDELEKNINNFNKVDKKRIKKNILEYFIKKYRNKIEKMSQEEAIKFLIKKIYGNKNRGES